MSGSIAIGVAAACVATAWFAYKRGVRIKLTIADNIDLDNDSDSERPKRIAIYGGAFNPITNGHMQLATEIVHSGIVDEVWICPCGPRPDKPTIIAPEHRLAMCEISINQGLSPMFPIRVADHEITQRHLAREDGGVSTYDSLCYLRAQYPCCEFSFVIGSDWLQPGTDLRTWTSKEGLTGHRLVSEFDFLVAPRPGYEVPDLSVFGPRMKWVELPNNFEFSESNASSTEVRKRARREWAADPEGGQYMQALNGLVQPGVLSFILRYRLYAESPAPERPLSAPRKKVAVLGGAFSPPTSMHVLMATEIVASGAVDEVWLCPYAYGHDTLRVPPQQRYMLCEVAVSTTLSATFPVRVSDHEVRANERLATYDSLCSLRERFPQCDFSFVIGSDWLQPGTDLRTWKSRDGCTGERLVTEFDFLIFPRAGFRVPDLSVFGPRMRWMRLPDGFSLVESNTSSREVRKRANAGYLRSMRAGDATDHRDMDGLVPPAVLAYVRRHQLYKGLAYQPLWEYSARKVRELVRLARSPSSASLTT